MRYGTVSSERGIGRVIISEIKWIYQTSSPHSVGKSPACMGLRSAREKETSNGLFLPVFCAYAPLRHFRKKYFRLGELEQWQLSPKDGPLTLV